MRTERLLLLWGVLLAGLVGCEDQPAADRPESPAPSPTADAYAGGPMPLKEATMVADRAAERIAESPRPPEPKVRQAFREEIVQLLAHGQAERRAEAAEQLGEFRRSAAVEALYLASGVGEPNRAVRAEAVEAIGAIGQKDTAMIAAARLEDPAVEVRQAAAEAVGKLGNPQVVDLLADALSDPEERVRESACRSLGLLRDARATEALIEALRDSSPKVRAAAAGALGRIGDAAAVVPLILALNDPSALVRYQAVGALASLGDARGIGPIRSLMQRERDDAVRSRAKNALEHLKANARQASPTTAPGTTVSPTFEK